MKIIMFFLGMYLSTWVLAEPTLKGKAKELEDYLAGIPKTVTLTASVTQSLPLNKAAIKLSVVTEAILLADALKENSAIRKRLRWYFEKTGIVPDNIKESKFSSTPKYGIFSGKPKSYKVENNITINVTSEPQMIAVASATDDNKNVYYLSSKAEAGNDEDVKTVLLEKALAKSKEKASIYEKNLGVKLIPVAFIESQSAQPAIVRTAHRKQQLSSTAYEQAQPTSFGEANYRLAVSVTYQVHKKEE